MKKKLQEKIDYAQSQLNSSTNSEAKNYWRSEIRGLKYSMELLDEYIEKFKWEAGLQRNSFNNHREAKTIDFMIWILEEDDPSPIKMGIVRGAE